MTLVPYSQIFTYGLAATSNPSAPNVNATGYLDIGKRSNSIKYFDCNKIYSYHIKVATITSTEIGIKLDLATGSITATDGTIDITQCRPGYDHEGNNLSTYPLTSLNAILLDGVSAETGYVRTSDYDAFGEYAIEGVFSSNDVLCRAWAKPKDLSNKLYLHFSFLTVGDCCDLTVLGNG